jgi:hypothetical protein
MRLLPLLALALLPTLAVAEPPKLKGTAPNLDTAAGVYKHRFANGDVQGDNYTSEDILELVKVSPKTAYFRIHGEFFNGHTCDISGIADLMSDALTYFGPPDYDKKPCVLKFTANAKGLIVEDVDYVCREQTCGARGGYDNGTEVTYPFAWRRTIRYMPRLLASTEYKAAVAEHNSHPIGTPAPDQ